MAKNKKIVNSEQFIQFSIRTSTKDALDVYKLEHKEDILTRFKKKKRFVTNDDAVKFLLETRVD